jgi:hypothetical protein
LASKLVLVCGDKEIDLVFFMVGVVFSTILGKRHLIYSNNWLVSIVQIMAMRASDEAQERDILSLLNRFRPYKATDPRDKIFALFGLTSTSFEGGMHPDYGLDVTDCYKRTALSILSTYRNRDLFSTTRTTTAVSQRLPSWVPDWTTADSTASLLGLNVPDKSDLPKFSASNGSTFRANVCQDVLLLSGHTVDQIQHLGAVLTLPKLYFADHDHSIDSVRDAARFFWNNLEAGTVYIDVLLEWDKMALAAEHLKYPTGEDPLRVYCWTLCAGDFLEGPEHACRHFMKWRTTLRVPRRLRQFGLHKVRGLYKVAFPLAVKVFSDLKGKNRAFPATMNASLNRRLARSSNGYLALVPADSRVGDSFFLLRGGRVPFVCRPRGSEWELVGDSYVHGTMHGEAWEESKCKDVNLC